ncbi:hypothetical protein JCM3775_001812 [Rhodotorula graminis]|uniref:NADH dehydrogenase [ubiquinone] 1 alpha subcomplex subunit n=1 Tax=Rhodotorula graminis (strain WP1) TaxID=578459 RepID=A0A194S2Z9_RHOGW|nr:uncharacterized protein RHOBADRAFT_66515 [Rhodotorula graminis WP1]KPV74957.1 hypothetical protein RHOBADRAFT_66515 [Rhodotorula graminis WP1]
MGPILTPSIRRVIQNIRQVGPKQAWRDLQYIGDFKAGKFVGQDEHGNRFFENPDETLWRHRWVDYASHDYNASQITPEWHAWVQHVRHLPPTQDPVMIASKQRWMTPHTENLTGTRGAFKTYSTTKNKVDSWEPKVAARQ